MRVTVVDSGSPDATPEMVEREFPAVRLIRRPNVGFSAANNLALRESEAEAVLLLNPDTEVYAGTLDAALARLRSEPRIGMVGVKLITESGELDHACKRSFPTPLSALAHFTGIGRGDGASARPRPVPGHPPGGRRAGRGRRRQRRLHALPGRGGARGRPARRGLLALHGGPRLVPALLGCRLEGLLRAGRGRPARQGRLQRRPPRPAAGDRLPSRHGPLLPPLRRPRAQPARSTPPSTRASAPNWPPAWRSPPSAASPRGARRGGSRRLRRGSGRSCRGR